MNITKISLDYISVQGLDGIQEKKRVPSDYVKEENLMALHDKCFPRCITYAQWKLWRNTFPRAGVAGVCEDCTPDYQNEMCMLGKCDHPEILFYVDDDGMIFGSLTPRVSENAINIKVHKK